MRLRKGCFQCMAAAVTAVAGGPSEGLGGAVVIAGGEVDGNPAEVVPAAVDVVGVVH